MQYWSLHKKEPPRCTCFFKPGSLSGSIGQHLYQVLSLLNEHAGNGNHYGKAKGGNQQQVAQQRDDMVSFSKLIDQFL